MPLPPTQRRLFGPRPAPLRAPAATIAPAPPLIQCGRALRRHGWILLVALLVCAGAAAAMLRLMQPVYQAAASIELSTPAPAVQFPGTSANGAEASTDPVNVAEELANPQLVAQAAGRIGPGLIQHFWRCCASVPTAPAAATAAALRQLQIEPVPHSQVIQLQFQAPRAGVAAAFLDDLVHAYQLAAAQRNRAAGLDRVTTLSQRVDAARAQVDDAQADLTPFTHAGPAPPAALALAEQRRQQLEQAETAAEIAALQQADTLAAAPEAEAPAAPSDLEVKRAELEAEIRRLATIYQPQAAPLEQARQQLAGLDASVSGWRQNHQLTAQHTLAAQRQQVRDLTAALTREGQSQSAIAAQAAAYDVAQRRLQADQDTYSGLLDQLQQAVAETGATPSAVRLLAPPEAQPQPLRPNLREAAAYAVLLGLIVGILGIAGLELAHDAVWAPEAAELGTPLVALLPRQQEATHALALATLAAALTRAQTASGLSVLLITSVEAGVGKTTLSWEVARCLTREQAPVLLLDGHLQRPGLHQRAGHALGPGVRELLAGRVEVEQVLHSMAEPALAGISVIAAGENDPSALVDLASGAAADLLAAARQRYGWVIVDGGCLLEDAGARLWAGHADCCLVLAGYGRGSRRRLRQALALLAAAGGEPVGLVLNRVPQRAAAPTAWLPGLTAADGQSTVATMGARRWA